MTSNREGGIAVPLLSRVGRTKVEAEIVVRHGAQEGWRRCRCSQMDAVAVFEVVSNERRSEHERRIKKEKGEQQSERAREIPSDVEPSSRVKPTHERRRESRDDERKDIDAHAHQTTRHHSMYCSSPEFLRFEC